jgi:Tat protein translocase TatB subunit
VATGSRVCALLSSKGPRDRSRGSASTLAVVFNVGGGEIIVILVMALLVLGPERLPTAGRQIGRALAEFRRVSTGVQQDLREALNADELLETVGSLRDAVDIRGALRDEISSVTSAFTTQQSTTNYRGSTRPANEPQGEEVASPDGLHAGDRPSSASSGTIVGSPNGGFTDVLMNEGEARS